MTGPARGFPPDEFAARVRKAQALMDEAGLSVLLLTTEPEVRYYTGFLTRFWESPTRPWFVVLPGQGAPVAVIPSIGAYLMSRTWITDIRTWTSPDYEDDGIGLLADTLRELTPNGGTIGVADGIETHLRMPMRDFARLKNALGSRAIAGDAAITRRLRMVKSDREIDKIRHAARIAGHAFGRVSEIATPGVPLAEIFRRFQCLCLDAGADWVPYLAGAADRSGYHDVISPATERPLEPGDVLMLDTGLVRDGYFCDFNRNFVLGPPASEVRAAHSDLIEACRAAFDSARPGNTVSDLHITMHERLGDSPATGRMGHGLGMQLTEWPSVMPGDHTVLAEGMVLTLEPVVTLPSGRILVHEEDIVVRADGAEYLSDPQPPDITVL